MSARKTAFIGNECVACGACLHACPVGALSVPEGLRAVVQTETCVGCGKCARACPAGVIDMTAKEETPHA